MLFQFHRRGEKLAASGRFLYYDVSAPFVGPGFNLWRVEDDVVRATECDCVAVGVPGLPSSGKLCRCRPDVEVHCVDGLSFVVVVIFDFDPASNGDFLWEHHYIVAGVVGIPDEVGRGCGFCDCARRCVGGIRVADGR